VGVAFNVVAMNVAFACGTVSNVFISMINSTVYIIVRHVVGDYPCSVAY
jgi:hypothetical protein